MNEVFNLSEAKKVTGLSYLGGVNNGAKHHKAFKYGELVYTIYLAPANLSGYEVCIGRTPECTALCLNESGHNRMTGTDFINKSRIKKTKLFFENHEFFSKWVIRDIKAGILKAEKAGMLFSVRINNTSDISPEKIFITENGARLNLFQLFPNVQFYDYTKVISRFNLLDKYPNYDLTYSFNGRNMDDCIVMLNSGYRVAMVFEKVPESYMGFKVIDGDLYDMRYKDDQGVIVGLKFKKVRNKPEANNTFVIRKQVLIPEEVL